MFHRENPVYLLDFTTFQPPESWRLSQDQILEIMKKEGVFSEGSVAFLERMLIQSGEFKDLMKFSGHFSIIPTFLSPNTTLVISSMMPVSWDHVKYTCIDLVTYYYYTSAGRSYRCDLTVNSILRCYSLYFPCRRCRACNCMATGHYTSTIPGPRCRHGQGQEL